MLNLSKTKKAWPSKFDHDEVKPAVRQEEPLPYACADLHPGWHPLVNVHNNFLNNCFYKSNLLLLYTVNLHSVAENKHSSPISSIISIMAVPGQE